MTRGACSSEVRAFRASLPAQSSLSVVFPLGKEIRVYRYVVDAGSPQTPKTGTLIEVAAVAGSLAGGSDLAHSGSRGYSRVTEKIPDMLPSRALGFMLPHEQIRCGEASGVQNGGGGCGIRFCSHD